MASPLFRDIFGKIYVVSGNEVLCFPLLPLFYNRNLFFIEPEYLFCKANFLAQSLSAGEASETLSPPSGHC